jgi:hypothetical protein
MKKHNDVHFQKIEHAWRKWTKECDPYRPELMVPVSVGVAVAVCTLRFSVNSYWGAGILMTLWLTYLFWMLTRKWEPILNRHLQAYEPVDRQAYADLQNTILSAGKLEKSALGEWMAVERKARKQER